MARLPDGTSGGAETLVALLRRWNGADPDAPLFSFLPDGDDGGEIDLTRGVLDRRARELAARLQARGLSGERALLLYPPGLEFIVAFFGCLYARVVAVPAYPPRPNRPMTRLTTIVDDARPAVVLTCDSLRKDATRWSAGISGLDGVAVIYSDETATDGQLADGEGWADPGVTADTLAFLQYTSGSTAAPKGVMITHGNLLANSVRIQAVFGSVPGEHGVFWLPLFHDMGLIGGVIQTLYCGGSSTLFPPVSFLQRPLRWLEAISRTGAIISGGPNFAYELCIEKSTPEQRAALDLSRWKVAFNGAEPVRADTLDRFAEAFAPSGFRPEAFLPCYGLAEATLLVSGNPTGHRPAVIDADTGLLGRGEVAEASAEGAFSRLVSNGRPAEGHLVAIVDPATERPCPENHVGEIWVAGPSVARGYWGRIEETGRSMNARLAGDDEPTFLRTGDLGFLREGELFVTGRIKDMIILSGRNIYPQDVEWAAERSHPALRAGGAGAFAVEVDGEERLAIVIETERRLPKGAGNEILAAIRRAVAETLDVEVFAIRLIKPTSLPRTSSGKVQRHACRDGFLNGTLETAAEWTRQDRPAEATPAPTVAEPTPCPAEPIAAPSRSRREIAAWLSAKVAAPLGVRVEDVDIRAPLSGFGIGSLQAVRLAGELEEWLGRKLSPTLVYDYPTILTMAGHLAGEPVEVASPRPAWTGGREPIAIVGIGCRFPGASGPLAFWHLLREGVEAIGEVPDARWTENDLRGLDVPRRSGFLSGIDQFDASFFGINRREAMFLDPQHRMLLETAWEALEDAGQSPDRLAGAPVGVFIGISTNDYAFVQVKRGGAAIGHRVTGNSGSIAANRISHFFDFRGPSLAIDTACSSSLVATLQACRSIWEGESEVALAGGSNLLLQTQVFAGFARSGFLSSDGHCRAFDADANGYVRGEGAGIVVLKPISRALADGDAIYALIRGGAINQDGRTNGLTAPSRPAQEAVLRAAYRHAGVAPGQVDYIEAHGTGTPLGDPIELAALGAVLADGREPGRRCTLGSVKTNIGHLEAAAGVAGLIKVALALRHGTIPASLNYSRPNPHAELDRLPLKIARTLNAWPSSDEPARAGISAFGFGGTNAHLVLEEAPRVAIPTRPDFGNGRTEDVVIPLSARTPEALAALCRSFRDFLANDGADLIDVAYSAGARRAHLEHRLALVVGGREEAIDALDAVLRGTPHVDAIAGRRRPGLLIGPVFDFGDGSGLRPAAARALFDREPAFRAAIERIDPLLRQSLGWSLAEALNEGALSSCTDSHADAFRFAVQSALASVWESWGIAVSESIGEGVGAIASAYVSGRIELDEAARILAGRAKRPMDDNIRTRLAELAALGHETIIEIGGGLGSTALIRAAFEGAGRSVTVLSTLRPGDVGLESLRWSAAFLYASGYEVEWSRVLAGGRFVRLPNYPWQRERYWLDQEAPPPRHLRRREAAPIVEAPAPETHGHAETQAAEVVPAAEPARRPDLVAYLRDRVANLLGLPADQLDIDRSLLALGLDSIAAMELKLDIDEYLNAKLPLSILSEGSSTRDVADRALQHLATIAESSDGPPPRSEPTTEPAAVRPSHGQRMLWYAHQFASEGAAYHIAGAGVVRGGLDLDAIRRALHRVIDRHDALRSTFPTADEGPSLQILDTADLVAREREWLILEDAAGLDPTAIPSRLTALVRRPFDLERGPLFRIHVLSPSASEQLVLPVFHHIISDFLSAAVFLDDLGRAYAEEVSGRAETWPEPSSFYAFARQQEAMLAGAEGARLWDYWQRQLDGPLPVLDLPTDFPRPIVRGDRGQLYRDALDRELSAALASLGESHGASLYTTLLSAFQVFLARWAGQDEVIVGSPVANRTRAGIDSTVGYLVNMLPMRARLSDDPTFIDVLTQTRRTVTEGLEHLEFPFSLMVERLGAAADPGRSPIFQVMYAHQRTQKLDEHGLAPFALGVPGARLNLRGLAIDSVAFDRETALFELSLMTARDGDQLRLAWEYSTELFAERTIETMAAGFRALLAAIVADPSRRLSDLPILSADDRHRALEWWAVGPELTPAEGGIHRRFEREAAASPDAIALVSDEGTMTYGELNRQANILARELIQRDVGPEFVVGLFLERWPLRLIGVLGVLKAGAAYLPLDPGHPDERLAAAVDDASAVVIVTEAALKAREPSISNGTVVVLDRLLDASETTNVENPSVAVNAANLAYVIFTSGTTGRPKGVKVHHGALMASGSAWEQLDDLRGSVRRHLQAAPFGFDVFTGDWVRALTTGGTLIACPRAILLDPSALADRIREHEVDAVELVPALAETLADHLDMASERESLPLKLLALGSDTLRYGLIQRWTRLLPRGARVLNSYGLTEAAVDSLCFDHDGDHRRSGDAPAPIGRPMPGVRAYVLDRRLEPVPPGVMGELFIGGLGVSRGYLGDPSKTAARFLPDPFGAPGARMYATGDRARWTDEGIVELLGRADDQVKIRGVRVEPAEVETVLAGHPSLKQVAVTVREGSRGEKHLAAYYVPAATIEPVEVRRWLEQRLPDAMVPSWMIAMGAMPLTSNGKIDRAALPAPDVEETGSATPYVAPRTPREERLAMIASELLERERIGIHDNLFDMGLDSIVGIRMIARVRQAGMVLDPSGLFRTPTIAGLASAAEKLDTTKDEPFFTTEPFALLPEGLDRETLERRVAPEVGIEDVYPLTPVQAGMLFHVLADPEAGHYVEQFTCVLRGELDLPALREAWHRSIARHASLRCSIHWGDADRPYQVIHRRAEPMVAYHDWRGLAEDERDARLAAFMAADRRQGFDPARPPLSRLALLRLDQERHRLVWSVHHIAVDGWCLALLLHEALDIYEALRCGEEPEANTTRPYRDHVAWLATRDESEAETYWRRELSGFDGPTPMGLEERRDPVGSVGLLSDFDERELALEPEESEALLAFTRSRRITLGTLIPAAWSLLLSRYSGRSDVLFGLTVAGRPPELAGSETMIGLFINTMPLRVALDESRTLVDWLLGLQQRLADMRRFESIPLARIRSWSPIPAGRSLFESRVTVQNLPFMEALRGRANRLGVESPRFLERSHEPISLTALTDDRLRLRIGFDARRFTADPIERILDQLRNLLHAMTEGPDRQLADLPWIIDPGREPIHTRHNLASLDDSLDVPIPDLNRLDEGELDALIDRLSQE